MEELTAIVMRDELRACLAMYDGRGTVYFAREEGPLFYCSTAMRHEATVLQELVEAFNRMGYMCSLSDGKIAIWPDDTYLRAMAFAHLPQCGNEMQCTIAGRLCLHKTEQLTCQGRQLIIEVLRLDRLAVSTGQDRMGNRKLNADIDRIRQRAAILLRRGDTSGLHEAGCFLYEIEQKMKGRVWTSDMM